MLIMIHGAVLPDNQPGINQYAERRGCNTYRIAGFVGTVRMVTSRADREASRTVRDERGELNATLHRRGVFRMVLFCLENKLFNVCNLPAAENRGTKATSPCSLICFSSSVQQLQLSSLCNREYDIGYKLL